MAERCTVIGTIHKCIFQNEENGYAVLRVITDDGELITVVGTIPCPAAGEELVMTGCYTTHPQHGEQFSAEEVERQIPSDEEGIYAFLSSGVIEGIGAATAKKIVDHFGVDTFAVIESEPQRLTEIAGITQKRAKQIAVSFTEQMGLRELMHFLTQYELPTALSAPLIREYGVNAVARLRENPYILSADPFLLEFSQVDEIALAMGVSADASCRTEAAVIFELAHNENNGHVFLPRDKLIAATYAMLGGERDMIETALDALIARGAVAQEDIAGVRACYLARLYEAECYVHRRLRSMLSDIADAGKNVDKIIREIERKQSVEYTDLQRRAVEIAAEKQVLILTGGPGTGKTTTIRGIVALFERMGLQVMLAAPTGRAAKRMSDLCGCEAQTIHRMLGMTRNENGSEIVFTKCEKQPVEADALIVDEMSMVDLQLMRALLAALRPGCRLVMVGDPDQLPSVGAGNVFSDMIRSDCFDVVALTEIFRQAQDSAIIRHAHAINRGELPSLKNDGTGDFFFLPRRDRERAADTIVELCRDRLPNKLGIPVQQIQVICPTRKGAAGTAALNTALQNALNPPSRDKRECSVYDMIFREGDRVMQIRNDYDILWEREDGSAGSGIFNGDVGTILQIDPSGELLTIAFDDRIATYTADQLTELDMAYAITVHKAQGSEYRAVIFAPLPCAPSLMVRSILYTAVTRAKELLVLVGDDSIVGKMAENDRRQRRYSGLRWRLCNM